MLLEPSEIHRATVETGHGAGLEAADREPKPSERGDEAVGGGIPGAAAGLSAITVVQEAAQERARGEDHRAREVRDAKRGADASDTTVIVGEQVLYGVLLDGETLGVFERASGERGVTRLVGLAAPRTNGGSLGDVEPPELDAGSVCEAPHEPAERVDLSDEMALAHPPNSWVAAHGTDPVGRLGEQEGATPEPARRVRRLDARMAGTNHDDVIDRLHACSSSAVRAGTVHQLNDRAEPVLAKGPCGAPAAERTGG